MTCSHYRYQVPREDADEFRALDSEPCPVCDDRKAAFQMVNWSPVQIRAKRRSLFRDIGTWLASTLRPEPVLPGANVANPATRSICALN